MFTFNSDALAQLFHETYHQAMSVRLVICSQEGLFLEFRNGLPGQLFYRKERIYALEYSGGSADPGVQVELNFGQISETYALTVDDPTFFSPITPADKVVVLSVRSTYQLKRKTISWLSQHKLGLFRERMDLMRTADFCDCSCDEERARWFGSAASMLEEAMFTDSKRHDHHDFYHSRRQLRSRLNSITADGKIISPVR
ncbi:MULTISPECIES: hypothetical protein [Erwiniaceae]|jgi:hypothetical protein|uniref:hypothetical protein n=1 Tax=Erwiniaceae TaxID=1903409 RepID=UPI00111E901F|nr:MULTISPECIES: hypothetical protein [Erwiniaceae]MCW0938776.1 hypothetical protein [Pantoea sp. RG18]MDN4628772.1 hypothetical protein [Erwinia sp. PsM31]TPD89412.1 hypothetical protein FJP68_21620 [Pantoea vagans]